MREIPLAEFIDGYEKNLINDVCYIDGKVYGRSVKGQADNPQGYEVVWSSVP